MFKKLSGKENSEYKVNEVGIDLASLRKSKKPRMAGAE